MCFSAIASFSAGSALTALGVATLTITRRRAEFAIAAIPLLFGLQQLVEGFVWLTLPSTGSSLNSAATLVYSLFSHVLWPFFVPLAVALIEKVPWRRKALFGIGAVGAAVSAYLLYALFAFPITSAIDGGRIVYLSPHFYVAVVLVAYLSATCLSSLLSSHTWVRVFGALAILSAAGAYLVYARAFISVWCFFAAILSVFVFAHLKFGDRADMTQINLA